MTTEDVTESTAAPSESTTEESSESSSTETGRLSTREALELAAAEHGIGDEEDSEPTAKPAKAVKEDTKTSKQPRERISRKAIQAKVGQATQQAPQAEQAPQPPNWWTKEEKDAYSAATPELKKSMVSYAARVEGLVRQKLGEADQIKRRMGALDQAFEPVRQKLYKDGLDEATVIRRYLGWQEAFENDPVGTLRELAQANGVTPDQIFAAQQENNGPADPRLDQAMQAIEQLKSEIQSRDEQVRNQSLSSEVNAFKAETDEHGNLKRPYFDFFEPQLAMVITAFRREYPQAPNYQILDAAYRFVIDKHNEAILQPQLQQSQGRTIQAAQAKAQAAKKASASVTSSPGATGAVNQRPKGIRQALEMASEMVASR